MKNLVLLAALLALTACDQRPGVTDAEQQNKTGKILEAGVGKPAAPVRLEAKLPADIEPGDVFDISLTFTSATTEGTLQVDLSASDQLEIIGPPRAELGLSGSALSLNTRLLGDTANLHYLNVVVREYDAQGAPLMGKSFSIPIAIGASKDSLLREQKAERGEALKIVESEGERLIELPAEQR